MGNHQSQAAELGPAWSRTLPRDRAGRLLSYGGALPLPPPNQAMPHRVPGQKLQLSPSLPLDVDSSGRSALSRAAPQNRSVGHLTVEDRNYQVRRTPSELRRIYGSEPDLRDLPDRKQAHEHAANSRQYLHHQQKQQQRRKKLPPPELTLPPPPGEPPPPIIQLPTPPEDGLPPRRRLFRPNNQRRSAGGPRHGPTARAASEDRVLTRRGELEDGAHWRTQSIDCLHAVLNESIETTPGGSFASLCGARVPDAMANERSQGQNSGIPTGRGLKESHAVSHSEGALQNAEKGWYQDPGKRIPHSRPLTPDFLTDERLSHKIKITLSGSSDAIHVAPTEAEQKPKQFFFGMEPSADHQAVKKDEGQGKKVSALAKVKHNEEVDIIGRRVIYQRHSEKNSESRNSAECGEAASHISLPKSEAVLSKSSHQTANIKRIPTQKFNDFMTTLERSKRIQLSVNREEILTNSPVRSSGDLSSPTASELDMELKMGADSISMHLRPTLPKKQQQIPRFSPVAAWKSLHVDENSSREWRDQVGAKEPLREQLSKHRPITRSADSGIGGETATHPPSSPDESLRQRVPENNAKEDQNLASSLPDPGRPGGLWTPAQDVDISSGDDASLDVEGQRLNTLPRLIHRNNMFVNREEKVDADGGLFSGVPVKSNAKADSRVHRGAGNSAKRAKKPSVVHPGARCSSLDNNWMLSRSVPNSLNDAELHLNSSRRNTEARLEKGISKMKQHGMYLPEYNSMQVERGRSVSPYDESSHRQDLRDPSPPRSGTLGSLDKNDRNSATAGSRRKFAFQSTLRLIEKKKLETRLSREAEEKERLRRIEQETMERVEREFQQKRIRENQQVLQQHQQRIQQLESVKIESDLSPKSVAGNPVESVPENIPSSDITSSSSNASDLGFSSHKESPQSSPRSASDMPGQFHLPAPARVLPHDANSWEPPPECPAPDYNSLPPLLDQLPPAEVAPASMRRQESPVKKPGFLSGMKNWLRGRKETRDMTQMRREEPEGEASGSPDASERKLNNTSVWRRGQSPAQGYKASGRSVDGASDLLATDEISRIGVKEQAAWSTPNGAPSPSNSANPQLSSGYESSPSLDTSKRLTDDLVEDDDAAKQLTHEMNEYREEVREYREYRTPAQRYQKHTQHTSRSPMSGRSRATPNKRPKTPTGCFAQPIRRKDRLKQQGGVAVGPRGEAPPPRPHTSHGNYRRAFAWGTAPHPSLVTAAPPERDCRTPHSIASGERSRDKRAPRPMPVFQRSLSQHELHFRGGRLRGPVGRGWSDERLDVPRRRPPPAQAALQPTMLQHRGYVPRYINNSPARFAHGIDFAVVAGGARPPHLGPARPDSAFAV